MKAVPNARKIALRSHSMWANYLGILCLIAPELIYWITGRDTNPRLWWIAAMVLIVYGILGRLKSQGIDHRTRSPAWIALLAMASMGLAPSAPSPANGAPVSIEAFSAVAVPLVAKWEGKRNKAYYDTIAVPPVWTVCYGETRGVRRGDHYSDADCFRMLRVAVLDFRRRLHPHFTDVTKATRLTPKRDAAYVSLAYNAGVYAISRSTAVRRLNAGDIAGGCVAIGWWNKSGGRLRRGLANRRAEETAYCLSGLS